MAALDLPGKGDSPSTAIEMTASYPLATTHLHRGQWYYTARVSQNVATDPSVVVRATLRLDDHSFQTLYLTQLEMGPLEEGAQLRWCIGGPPPPGARFHLDLRTDSLHSLPRDRFEASTQP